MKPPRKMPDWAYNQMIDGLQKLLVLRLQGAPPADTISALAAVWEEALTPHTWAFERDLDEQRLPSAFRQLIAQAERWQQPAQLIKLIPPRPERQVAGLLEQKTPPPTPEQRQHAAENKRQILQHLSNIVAKGSLKSPKPKTPDELLYEWSRIYDPATGKKRDQPLPDNRKRKS
ncbi:hypothetical protein ACKLNO_03885 [Neisseriaceae bacterium B1]